MDCFVPIVAVILVTTLWGQSVALVSLAAGPLVVLMHKLAGLYDRDELVLKRSTLDEVPASSRSPASSLSSSPSCSRW